MRPKKATLSKGTVMSPHIPYIGLLHPFSQLLWMLAANVSQLENWGCRKLSGWKSYGMASTIMASYRIASVTSFALRRETSRVWILLDSPSVDQDEARLYLRPQPGSVFSPCLILLFSFLHRFLLRVLFPCVLESLSQAVLLGTLT